LTEATFQLLGPLEIRSGDDAVRISGSRQRTVLALLLLNADRVVPSDRLTTAVWDDDPPTTARSQIQISISKLRALFAGLGLTDAISTRAPGYALRVPGESIDAVRFARLVVAARGVRAEDPERTVVLLRQALGLWRGDAMAGTESRLVRAAALRLDEDRLAAIDECLELEVGLGRHRQVVGELRDLLSAHPLHERFYTRLMAALYLDGRQAEALEVYRRARHVLVEENGLIPGDSLRAMEHAVLNGTVAVPSLTPAPAHARTESAAKEVPRQLPVRANGFVGRDSVRASLRAALSATGENPEPVVVTGPAGIGKSALAVEMAYELAERFPDGQLFARLRGADARPVPPEQILGYFLRSLGVPPSTLPDDRDSLEGLYRSKLAGKRLLVLLDDAANTWQVEPLLPATAGVATVVTSRWALAALPNARRVELLPFGGDSSHRLITQIVGAARVSAEPAAASAIAAACAHLPLALQIAAAKLAARPHWRLADMANRLSDENDRLDELSIDGTGVRASISVSLDSLGDRERLLLLLLSALGSTDFAAWVCGPLLDLPLTQAAGLLDELVDARLVEVNSGTSSHTRYRLHDLVRVLARELLAGEVAAADRADALHRLLRCWWFLTTEAHRREYGGDFTSPRTGAQPWPLPRWLLEDLLEDPIGWFESEHANAMAAVRLAADLGHPALCGDLAVSLVTLFEARAHREDWRTAHEVALDCARSHGDRRTEARVRLSRAGLAFVEQRLGAAGEDLTAALTWFDAEGDRHGRGLAERGLGGIDRLQGRHAQARARYLRAVEDLRATGDAAGEAHVLTNLARVELDCGNSARSESLLQAALDICTTVGVRRVAAQARYSLGVLLLDQGRLDLAQSAFTEVLSSVTAAEDPAGKAYALLGVGTVHLARADAAAAATALAEASELAKIAGSRVGEGRVLLAQAELAHLRGDADTAQRTLDEAEATFAAIDVRGWLVRCAALRARLG
jgi:DNA-binding SARP family transcriptional activator/tetratricopeptide (TPR) repeat protein